MAVSTKSPVMIDLGGYGPPMSYGQIGAEIVGKASDPRVRALIQVLALKRETLNVDAGAAAVKGRIEAPALSAQADALRGILADLHTLLNGGEVPWLKSLVGEKPKTD